MSSEAKVREWGLLNCLKQKSDMIRTESFRKTDLSIFFSRVEYKKEKMEGLKVLVKAELK